MEHPGHRDTLRLRVQHDLQHSPVTRGHETIRRAAVVCATWNRSAARRSDQPSSTTHRAKRSRPVSVSGALRWGMRTSGHRCGSCSTHTTPRGPPSFQDHPSDVAKLQPLSPTSMGSTSQMPICTVALCLSGRRLLRRLRTSSSPAWSSARCGPGRIGPFSDRLERSWVYAGVGRRALTGMAPVLIYG